MFFIKILSSDNFFSDSLRMVLNECNYTHKYNICSDKIAKNNFDLLIVIFTTHTMTDILKYMKNIKTSLSMGKKVLIMGSEEFRRICEGVVFGKTNIRFLNSRASILTIINMIDVIVNSDNTNTVKHINFNKRIESINPKSMEVVNYLLKGLPTSVISTILNRNVKTISNHKRIVMHHLGVKTTLELVIKCRLQILFDDIENGKNSNQQHY